jgi:hypothetical protein
MVDMKHFTLTKHDDELYSIIKEVIHHSEKHILLAQWAIDCLSRVLNEYEAQYPEDTILTTAINKLQLWMVGKLAMWEARKYTFRVLEHARQIEKTDKTYAQIIRATSHALATCHVPRHAEGSAMYVISYLKLKNIQRPDVIEIMEKERVWQIDHLKSIMDIRNKKTA